VSVLTIVAGAWILIAPLTGAITLTVVLVAWFWALGVTRLFAWRRMVSAPVAARPVVTADTGARLFARL
jgi:uncharacterized membrane protein HdeD (DUF308 family)